MTDINKIYGWKNILTWDKINISSTGNLIVEDSKINTTNTILDLIGLDTSNINSKLDNLISQTVTTKLDNS